MAFYRHRKIGKFIRNAGFAHLFPFRQPVILFVLGVSPAPFGRAGAEL